MSHQGNDAFHDQMTDFYWEIYDKYIDKGYDAHIAEDLALIEVRDYMEKW